METLFASPTWLIAAIALLFVGLLLFGLFRGRKPLILAGGIALLLCAGWLAAALLVETPSEWALADAEAIATSYGDGDWTDFDARIDDSTRLEDFLVGEQIRTAARATRSAYGQTSVSVAEATAARDAVGVRVTLEVVSLQPGPPPRMRSAWQFDYRKSGDAWVLDRITILPTEQIDPDEIRSRIIPGGAARN